MKKNILLLLASALLPLGTTQAADPITKCYDEDATMTASPGDSHQWYKDGVKINGATNQSYTAVDLKASATYTCEVTTNGTSTNTGNLITLGGFEFPAKKPTLREENKLGDWIDYQYLNFDDKGVNIGIGACTTAKNANDVKTAYFSYLKPHSGDYLLVCDGASDPDARVWSARNLKLKGGVEYQFSCWAANIDKEYALHGANSLPKLKFVIENETGKHTLLEFTASTTLGEWNEYKATYTPPKDLNWCHIYIVNYTTEPAGNDFALDDVYFGTVINSAGSTKTETFNVTVYDTFDYKFKTEPVCPGAQATITTTLVPAHGGTLEPAANYKYEWKLNGTTPVVSTNKDLVVTAPSTVSSESYVLSTSSTVCYNSGAKSQTTSVKTKDCGRTETIDHPAVTVCTDQNVTLTCNKTGSSVKWSHDASLADTEITVTSSSTVGDANSYTCTITATENGSTVTYIENFTIKTKDCSVLYESTMCNNTADSTLTTQKEGDKYIWTYPNGDKQEAVLDNIKISHTDAEVGNKFAYSCEIYQNGTLIATENFEITITDCHKETEEEKEVQVKEDGSIKLVIPSENRCTDCIYNWYKKDENGKKGEPVVKNIGEEDWEHTVHNAKEEDYVCEIIKPNGNIHEQSYKVRVYVPKTSKYCYTKDSENEQYVTIDDLTVADRDEYEWYLIQGNDTIPMPEAAIISTENQKITLDVDYFVNNNSKFPVTVHILEEFAHKLQVESTEIQGGNNSTDVTPEPEPTPETPIAPAPDPVAPAAIPPIQINTSALSISSLNIINGGKSYSYEHTFEDANTSTVNIEIGQDYQYTEYFEPKVGGMTKHAGVVRLTNTGINGCHAYKGDDPNNEYFFEVDGGDKAGPIFSIVQEGKIIKGKKYILRFLARETSTDPSISGPTTNPAKIDFQITLNGNTYGVTTNQIEINKQDWTAHVFNYIANEDADNVILTLSNYNTDSGHNDFAIDEITFALADPSIAPENRSLKFRNLADENEGIVDEDGDGFVMWKDEHILSIYPNSSQTLVEVSSPNKEHETEVKLPNGEKVKFTYYPSMFQEGMTQYTESATREDEHGCKHTVNFTLNLVELEPDLYFSPNDDGVHDKWMVKGIETAPSAHIMIYDRHSKLLYKCLGSEFQGWDGTFEGHHMVQDDYWYVILIPETNETLSGHFTLKR